MATIDDALIDNLREGLAQHVKHGETFLLLSAAQGIVDQLGRILTVEEAEAAGRVQDNEGDIWTRGPQGWTTGGGPPFPLSEIVEQWGPLREVRDE